MNGRKVMMALILLVIPMWFSLEDVQWVGLYYQGNLEELNFIMFWNSIGDGEWLPDFNSLLSADLLSGEPTVLYFWCWISSLFLLMYLLIELLKNSATANLIADICMLLTVISSFMSTGFIAGSQNIPIFAIFSFIVFLFGLRITRILFYVRKYRPEFSLGTATYLLGISLEAYEDEFAVNYERHRLEKVHFFDDLKTDTQGFIARNYSRKRIVITFRGTTSREDALRGATVIFKTFPEKQKGLRKSKVHMGILNGYLSVRDTIVQHIRQILEEDPDYELVLTGHSMGGSLAKIAAIDLLREFRIYPMIYTFGCSRVGNRSFTRLYNRTITHSYRVINDEDFVSRYPSSLLGYRDTDALVTISNSRKVTVNPSVLQKVLSNFDNYYAFISGEAMGDHARKGYVETFRVLNEPREVLEWFESDT